MSVPLRSFIVLVTVLSVIQCAVLSAGKASVREKRDLDFIGGNMKEGLETAGTIVNVAQGVIGKMQTEY